MNLYTLTKQLKEVDDLLDAITEDLSYEEDEDLLDKEELARRLSEHIRSLVEDKSANIIKLIRNIDANIEELGAEIKRMQALKKQRQKKIEYLKSYTLTCMKKSGIEKVSTHLGDISINKAKGAVEILDESLIPEKYKYTTMKINISKSDINKDIKAGEVVEGAILVFNDSLRIPKPPKPPKEAK